MGQNSGLYKQKSKRKLSLNIQGKKALNEGKKRQFIVRGKLYNEHLRFLFVYIPFTIQSQFLKQKHKEIKEEVDTEVGDFISLSLWQIKFRK